MDADTVTTGQPVLGGGIRTVNFFNGRLLTGEDLTREQEANALSRLRLGRVFGSGVAAGLEVSAAASTSAARPVVRVQPGRAVDRHGRVLELSGAVHVALTRERSDRASGEVLFHDCSPLQPATYSAGAGVYLLAIAPAQHKEGRARVSGLGNGDAACATAFSVEGVQFHLLKVSLPPSLLSAGNRLRNELAHVMIGTADPRRTGFGGDPLGPPVGAYGLLDDLCATGCLADDCVPLAVLQWTADQGIRFVDLWSVRRRLTAPVADMAFPTLLGDRRRAEAEAVFLQFQQEVAEALAAGTASSGTAAGDRFTFLPPVGIVPVTGPGSTTGYDPDHFLGDQGSDELARVDAAVLTGLVQESLDHEPIPVGSSERIQRYLVWENEQAVGPVSPGQRVLVFAKHTLLHRGTARYGAARFGRSRFAPSVL